MDDIEEDESANASDETLEEEDDELSIEQLQSKIVSIKEFACPTATGIALIDIGIEISKISPDSTGMITLIPSDVIAEVRSNPILLLHGLTSFRYI